MIRPPIDNPSLQKNSQNVVEQPVGLTVEEAVISITVETIAPVVPSMPIAQIPSQEVVPPP